MALTRDQVGLIFRIDADAKPAIAEMEKLKSEVGKSAKNTQAIVRESFETLSSEIIESFGVDGDIANSVANQLVVVRNAAFIAAAGISAAFVAVGVGLVAAANKAAELGDQINDLRQITGLTAETLSGLNLAAAEEGKTLESLSGALVAFNKNLTDAQRGSRELQGVFKQLGVDFRGDTDAALRQAIERIAGMADGARKAAAAQLVFGDNAAALLPILNNLEGGVDKVTERAKELGLFFTNEGAEAAANYKEQIRQLGIQFDSLVVKIGNAVLPALTNFLALSRAALDKRIDLEKLALLTKIALAGGQVAPVLGALLGGSPSSAPGETPTFKPPPIGGTGKKKEDKLKEFEGLAGDTAKLQAKLAKEELDREIALNKLREDAAREHKRSLEQIEEISADRLIALIQSEADQRVITEQQAAEQIGAIRIAQFANREAQLKAEIDSARSRLRANAEAIEEQGETETLTAIREELLAEEQEFLDELEILQERRSAIEEESVRRVIEARRRDLESLIEFATEQRRLRAERLEDVGFGAGTADAIAGLELLLGRTLTFQEAFRAALQSIVADAKATLPKLSEVFLQSTEAIVGSVGEMIAAFVSGQSTIRQAVAAFYKAALQPLVDFLLKKARSEFALALADAAAFNFVGAAKHTLAGVALSAAAGLIGAGGAAIAGSAGGTIAPSSGFSGGSAGSGDRGTRVIEQGDRQRPVITVNLIAEMQEGVTVRLIERDYQNNGPTRKMVRRDVLGES